jgi:hypothetical protein
LLGTRHGWLEEGRRRLLAKCFVWPLVVVGLDKPVEALLLLQEVRRGWTRGLALQVEVHSLVLSVLLGMTGRDPLRPDPEPHPAHC